MSRLSYAGGPAESATPRREAQPGVTQARALMDHLGWIAAAGVAGAAAGLLVALSAPPQYRAQALV